MIGAATRRKTDNHKLLVTPASRHDNMPVNLPSGHLRDCIAINHSEFSRSGVIEKTDHVIYLDVMDIDALHVLHSRRCRGPVGLCLSVVLVEPRVF